MEPTGTHKTLLVAIGIIILIVGAGAGYFYGVGQGKEGGIAEGKRQGLEEAAEKARQEAAAQVNPFSGVSPVNPFAESTNPLENVKTNPFE